MPIRIVPGTPPHDVWIDCDECGARWLGQPFDQCEWCEEVAAEIQRRTIERLLFPEFLNWGNSYHQLSEIDQQVWATTRGQHRDFQASWFRKLREAKANGVIRDDQVRQALGRYRKWIATQMRKS